MKYQKCLQKLDEKILNEVNEAFKDENRNDLNILVSYKNILKERFKQMEEAGINDIIWPSVIDLLEKLSKVRKGYLMNEIFEFLIKMGGFDYDYNQRLELQNKLKTLDDHKWSKFIQDTESEINEKITDEYYILTKFPYFLENKLKNQIEDKIEDQTFYFRIYKFFEMLMKLEAEKNGDNLLTIFFIFFVMFYEKEKETLTIKQLYKNIKAIFINSVELIDFPLGDSKPDNLYYVGGSHSDNKIIEKVFVSLKVMEIVAVNTPDTHLTEIRCLAVVDS